MSMSVGGRRGLSADINMTPMIDVLLVLLIIFMCVLPHKPVGEEALIPQASKDPAPPPGIIDPTVVLQLASNPEGRPTLKLNNEEVRWENLRARLHAIFDTRQQRVIFVKADKQLEWQEVAQAIDIAHSAGILNVGLLTDKMQ